MPLTVKDYHDAIYVQSAVNLRAIARSLALVMEKMEGDTNAVNQHPIVRLYLEQMIHLNHGGLGDSESYLRAYTEVEKIIAKYELEDGEVEGESLT